MSLAHELSVGELSKQLTRRGDEDLLLSAPNVTLTVANTYTWQPDLYIYPRFPGAERDEHNPRIILEVEVDHLGLERANARCLAFFRMALPKIRAVVLIKYFATATLPKDAIDYLMGQRHFLGFEVRVLNPALTSRALLEENPWLNNVGVAGHQGMQLWDRAYETGPFLSMHAIDVLYNTRDLHGLLYQAIELLRIDL